MFKAVPDLMASALESGMPVEAALDGLSLGAVRLYLRSEIANPGESRHSQRPGVEQAC